jgi:pimeloyl-ACP methyl ester carboxylesterase
MIFAAIVATLSVVSTGVLALPDQSPPLTSPAIQERISVAVEGTGTDVILIPGLASSRDVWTDLADQLRQSHRLHLVQIGGFAGSPAVPDPDAKVAAPAAEAIAEYIWREHIEAPAIIGHSMGGAVALMLGARHPDQIGRLMVVDALPFYPLLFDPSATSETAAPHAAQMRDAMLAASPEQNEGMQKASIAGLAKTEAVRPGLVEAGVKSDRQTVADALYEVMTTDLRPELSRIKVPVEVVYAYDTAYPLPASNFDAMYRNAYASTPDVSFRRIDDSFTSSCWISPNASPVRSGSS